MSEAILRHLDDGRVIVVKADDVIHVHDSLWQEVILGQGDASLGQATIADNVLSFGIDGHGCGRVSYRWTGFLPPAGIHVLERIHR